ncbi:TAP42-like protein [Sporormia fimetaria CBS 119925]|uniref:TAP42-like protein n=1 Tax=Sporormia fimetaria CBS 119925 TaxID=1340428 RepID=A0A6A6V0Z2_9PLEO|nr:TAP42-like protein [Sporormia fimetaria CBS 119925]
MSEEPTNIRTLFLSAERAREALTSAPDSNSPTYQENLAKVIATYNECLKLSQQVSLFSSNETLEDVSSSDLQYMSIPYHLAELVQKIQTQRDPIARKEVLLKAQSFYERFLKLLDSYDMLAKSDAKLLEEYLDDRNNFTTVSNTDPNARRNAKILRYREEMEMKNKIDYLRRNPKLAENDEHVVRQLHLANIKLQVHQTFQSLESIAQELHILSLAPPAPPEGQSQPGPDARQDGRNDRDKYSDRLDSQLPGLKYSGPILSSDGKPLRPFTLVDNRQRMKQNVFRPDHNLPTMSIDEYLEEERRRGGIIEGGGEQSGIRPEPDEDNLDKADEETMKARAWDEFKEDNPKGAGNTINRG